MILCGSVMTPFPFLYSSYCLLKFAFACLTGSYLSSRASSLMPRASWYLTQTPSLTYGWAQPILTTSSRLLLSSDRSFCTLRCLCASLGTRRSLGRRFRLDCFIGGSARARCSLCSSSYPCRARCRSSRSLCFIRCSSRPLRSFCGSSGLRRFLCGPSCPDRSLCGSSRPCRSLCGPSSRSLHSSLWA